MKRLIPLILTIFITGTGQSADLYDFEGEYDSLLSILPLSEGKQRVDILCNLTDMLVQWDTEACTHWIEESWKLSNELEYQAGLGRVYKNRGDLAYYNDDYIHAVENYNKAAAILSETNEFRALGRAYSRIATIYLKIGNPDMAFEYVPLIKEAYLKGNHLDEIAGLHNGIGYYHNYVSGKAQISKSIMKTAVSIAINEHLKSRFVGGYTISLAYAYSQNGQIDSALMYYHRGLNAFNDSILNDYVLKTEAMWKYGYMIGVHMEKDSTLQYLKWALKRAESIKFIYGIYKSAGFIAQYYFERNDFQNALKYYNLAIENALWVNKQGVGFDNSINVRVPYSIWDIILRSMSPGLVKIEAKQSLTTSYLHMSKILESLGDINEGFRYHKLYHAYKDTLNDIARNRDMLAMQIRFESEKKTQQINKLSQENELAKYKIWLNNVLVGVLIGVAVIIAIIAILLIRQNRLKTLQQTNKLKQRLFRSQLNPHFIFNSIASIQNAIISEEPVNASRYLARFSKLVRNILDSTVVESISLEDEINTIENYLALQKLRYEELFEYRIEISEELDPDNIFIPPMLLQPFVENAIEHGIRNKDESGTVSVSVIKIDDELCIELEDNGVGRKAAEKILKNQNKNHKSLSSKIIQERIKIFNRRSKKKIKLEIIDLSDNSGEGCGTKVILRTPIDFAHN